VSLGEQVDTAQDWNNGALPALIPLPRVAGSIACINNGELLAQAADPATLIDGFPAACFQALGNNLTFAMASSFERCDTQKLWAAVIEWLYDFLVEDIVEILETWLGDDVTITAHPGLGSMPAVITVIHAEFTLAAVEGTTNFQQIALQAFDLFQAPQNYGQFSTASLWYNASQWIHEFLVDDGMQPGTPVFLTGHSYGACAMLILAARYRAWAPERVIRYLTYGAPKVGDARLHALLETVEGINLANDDDLVTVLPPDRSTLWPVEVFLGMPFLFVYTNWIRQPNQVRQDIGGELFPNDLIQPDYETLLTMIQRALDSEPQNPITGHTIPEYRRRIMLRCPECRWPLFDAVCELLPDEPEGVECACCEDNLSPIAFNATISSVAQPDFDGLVIQCELMEGTEPDCFWSGIGVVDEIRSIEVRFRADADDPGKIFFDGSAQWSEFQSQTFSLVEVDQFSCEPEWTITHTQAITFGGDFTVTVG